jgi:ABC-type amino acid transport substrate-binding protein
MRQLSLQSCCLALLLSVHCVCAATTVVIYPRSPSAADSQYVYDYELLRMAMEKTRNQYGPYEMRPSELPMNQARAAEEIISGSGKVTIFSRSTSIDHETTMLPIRIPIDKGLISYRVFLIRSVDQARLARIETLDQLRELKIGSFSTWADTKILRDGGFNVVVGESYEGLFKMLSAGRFDLFSRGADEAYREHEERKEQLPNLAVEDKLLLYFPTTRYFFVQRSEAGKALAARIELGLNRMIKDGSFDALFHKYKDPLIERAHLKSRRIFRIPNPYLSPETPLNRRELWYDPITEKLAVANKFANK